MKSIASDKLLIIGAGGHGKVVADIALTMNQWQKIAFLDDNKNIKISMGMEVIGDLKDVLRFGDKYDIFVAIGNNKIRENIQDELQESGAHIPILIHPSAIIGAEVEIGAGTAVMPGAVINCYSRIGQGCIINTGATIDHDNVIEKYVHISPGVHLGGTVRVGKSSWIGIGATVCNNVNITNECLIGAGAVVVRDIVKSGTYVGVPVRK